MLTIIRKPAIVLRCKKLHLLCRTKDTRGGVHGFSRWKIPCCCTSPDQSGHERQGVVAALRREATHRKKSPRAAAQIASTAGCFSFRSGLIA